MAIDCDRLFKMIKELIESKFYGELLIKLEAGNVVILKKTESIK